MASLVAAAARRTLLGSGSAAAMFPGLMGGASIWGGADDLDEEQGWKQF
jgi:hypothetical protein